MHFIYDETIYEIVKYLPKREILRLREVCQSFAYAINSCLHTLTWAPELGFESSRTIYDKPTVPSSLVHIKSVHLRNNEYLSLKELTHLWLTQIKPKKMKVENCSLMERPLLFTPLSPSTLNFEWDSYNPNVRRTVLEIISTPTIPTIEEPQPKKPPSFINKLLSMFRLKKSTSVEVNFQFNPGPKFSPINSNNYDLYVSKVQEIYDEYMLNFQNSLDISSLKVLTLSSTSIDDKGLEYILSNTPNLKSLHLSRLAKLADPNIDLAKDSLKKLTVEYCSNLSLTKYHECNNLTHLHVMGVVFVNDIFQFAGTCENLTTLLIGSTTRSGSVHVPLPTNRALKNLTLHSTSLSTVFVAEILESLPCIEVLHLVNLRDCFIPTIDCPTLKELYFSMDTDTTFINPLPNLELLSYKWIKSPAWDKNWHMFGNLKKLHVDQCTMSDSNLESLLLPNPNIAYLTASGSNISDPVILQTGLKYLDLSRSKLTSERLNTLLQMSPNMETLVLRSCNQIRDSISSRQLKVLTISGTLLTCKDILRTIDECPNLLSLDIAHCNNCIDWESNIEEFGKTHPLKELNISDYGKNMIDEDLNAFMKIFPCVRTLHCRWNHISNPDLSLLYGLLYLDIAGCNLLPNNIRKLKRECEKVVSV